PETMCFASNGIRQTASHAGNRKTMSSPSPYTSRRVFVTVMLPPMRFHRVSLYRSTLPQKAARGGGYASQHLFGSLRSLVGNRRVYLLRSNPPGASPCCYS